MCPATPDRYLIDAAYDTRIRLTLIDLLAGFPVTLPSMSTADSAIRFLAAAPGKVTQIDDLSTAKALPGVQSVEVDVEVGQQVRPWASSWDRAGHVIVTGPDAAAARQRALDADAAVHITTT